jgi:hypothetical protein
VKKSLRVLLVVAAIVAIVAMSGCGAIVEQAVKSGVESATGVKVDNSGGAVTVTGKDGSSTTVGGKELPTGFPSDVPVFEGAITSAMNTKGDKGEAFLVGIDAATAPAEVATWYKDQLAGNGWTVDNSVAMGEGTAIQATKLPNALTVTIAPGSGEVLSNIVLSVGPK